MSLAAEDFGSAGDIRLVVRSFAFAVAIRGDGISRRIAWAISFAWREKQVRLQAVLLRVKLKIAAAPRIERFVRALFDDSACLDHQDLVCSPNRGQPVSTHKCRASLHEIRE